jgi:serine/threonine protein kinase
MVPGESIGSYRVLRQLGEGGMGAVHLAYDTTLHRHVALQTLDAEVDAGARTRLVREARNAAALNHPRICTIHEVGDAGGSAFIAMEYVEGASLREQVDAGALPIDEALAYAHTRGVVHRDFKAANAIVTGEGRLKVVDFGLARRGDALLHPRRRSPQSDWLLAYCCRQNERQEQTAIVPRGAIGDSDAIPLTGNHGKLSNDGRPVVRKVREDPGGEVQFHPTLTWVPTQTRDQRATGWGHQLKEPVVTVERQRIPDFFANHDHLRRCYRRWR